MSSKLRQQVEAQMNKQKRSAVAYNKQEDRYPHPKEQERQQKQPRVFSDKLDKSLDAIMVICCFAKPFFCLATWLLL